MTSPPDYDFVIHNALIYDGDGGAPYAGGVAVQGDRLARVGPLAGARGRIEITQGGMQEGPLLQANPKPSDASTLWISP